ncbi:MAG: fused MFS/spermidine synthase [Mariniblastus sp.]
MIRYASTIFLSAFLLFQVQPMIAKFILPWFGGTSSVWTTCMLFFQFALLLGYCYAHLVNRYLTHKQQWILHACLMAVALIFLPVQPSDSWKPAGTEDPTWRMLTLLAVSIGFPFFLLSTTGPLVQSWQSQTHPNKSAYRLFAMSNFGSLLGLLGYPFLVEPYLRLGNQSLYWSIGFILFALLCLGSGWQLFRAPEKSELPQRNPFAAPKNSNEKTRSANLFNCVTWTLLAFAASAMLLATTNQMCQEVASVPFLWVLPLALYLLTFIICFENPRWYRRSFFFPLTFISSLIAIWLLSEGTSVPLPIQVSGYALVMFACCISCHGELAQAKPAEKDLTLFYLMISVGGALGGIFVVIVAPRLFNAYFEFHISLALCVGLSSLAFLCLHRAPETAGKWHHIFRWATLLIAIAVIGITTGKAIKEQNTLEASNVIFRTRNSYGTLYVQTYKNDEGGEKFRSLVNGRIKHGTQTTSPEFANAPISYYSPATGVGAAFEYLRNPSTPEEFAPLSPLHFGVVGLGTGTMAAWGEPGDSIKFYEINPAVEVVARDFFSYLSDSKAENIEVIIGDARIQLERHQNEFGSEKFDLLAIDAFSSDAIPMHLLTRECFKLYCDNLSDRGILAIHISNRYLNLGIVVYNLSNELGYTPFLFSNDEDEDAETDASNWVLVVKNKSLIEEIGMDARFVEWRQPIADTIWTDDFGSLTEVMSISNTKNFATEKLEQVLGFLGLKDDSDADEKVEPEEDDSESNDTEEGE